MLYIRAWHKRNHALDCIQEIMNLLFCLSESQLFSWLAPINILWWLSFSETYLCEKWVINRESKRLCFGSCLLSNLPERVTVQIYIINCIVSVNVYFEFQFSFCFNCLSVMDTKLGKHHPISLKIQGILKVSSFITLLWIKIKIYIFPY